ncbi:unnamed protein product, partial [marine sediment metagenome]
EQVSGCSNVTAPIPIIGASSIIDLMIAPPKTHTVSGTVSYHGAVQANLEVEVTTNIGTFPTGGPAITDASGDYSIVVQWYECPGSDTLTVEATEQVSGCSNVTAPIPIIGASSIIDLMIAPPKTHEVTGVVTYHGLLAGGVTVDVHTDAGTYNASMGAGGIYTANVEVFECPVDSTWAEAIHTASGCTNTTQANPVLPDPSGTTP